MIGSNDVATLLEGKGTVYSTDGDKIGSIGQVYLDDQSGEPSFATVGTGLFGTSESFVPLADATIDGNDLRVPYTKDQVKDAPRVEADREITPDEENELYRHYNLAPPADTYGGRGGGQASTGREGYTDRGTTDRGTEGDQGYTDRDSTERAGLTDGDSGLADRDSEGRGPVGHDTSGPTTDDAMTRSEERLRVGTEKQEVGRARLRKYIVTENVTTTVPVSREEVRIEREPITDANRGDALSGPDLSEEEHEVTLTQERPVVEKETVPVERVRLEKETVTDEETVTEQVRKEQIDTDGDTNR